MKKAKGLLARFNTSCHYRQHRAHYLYRLHVGGLYSCQRPAHQFLPVRVEQPFLSQCLPGALPPDTVIAGLGSTSALSSAP